MMKHSKILFSILFIVFVLRLSSSSVFSMAGEETEHNPSFRFSTRIIRESITIRREGFTTLEKLHKGQALLGLKKLFIKKSLQQSTPLLF